MDKEIDLPSLMRKVVTLLETEGILNQLQPFPVVQFKTPEKLRDIIINFNLGDEGSCEEDVLELCRNAVRHSVKTGNPFFLNQMYHGLDPYGLVGAWITEALNTNQHVYEVSPVFTMCELEVVQNLLKLVNFSSGDGIFCPGGSLANMYGLTLARYKRFPEVKTKGIGHLPQLVIYTSEDSHYSILKAAHWLGLGTDNVIRVKSDSCGRMIPSHLEEEIQKSIRENKVPLLVNGTLGTTVLGSFDPLDEIADICDKHDIWLHVDACWGGTFIFSKTYSPTTAGLRRAKSLSWNPHKMLGAPLQCSVFLVAEKGLLLECNSASAVYLFQKDKPYDVSYDSGDKSVQCGRKCDAFKLWVMWKARGSAGFGDLVDHAMHIAKYLTGRLMCTAGFKLVLHEFDSTSVSFWFIPPRLRNLPETEEWWDEIDRVAPKLKAKLVLSGHVMITFQKLPQRKLKNFFRIAVTCHPPPTTEQMDEIIHHIEIQGADL